MSMSDAFIKVKEKAAEELGVKVDDLYAHAWQEGTRWSKGFDFSQVFEAAGKSVRVFYSHPFGGEVVAEDVEISQR